MPDQGNRCKYCWHPPQPVEGHFGLHNDGCPTLDSADMDEWKRGHAFGFDDNYLEAWQYCYYTRPFVLGWRAGKDEIDALVEAVVESRC